MTESVLSEKQKFMIFYASLLSNNITICLNIRETLPLNDSLL